MRRLAFVFVVIPISVYAFVACSDDEAPAEAVDGGEDPERDGGGLLEEDAGTSETDGGEDAAPPTCVGNPLTADGAGDGGVVLSADAGTTVRTAVSSAGSFLDGPVFTDVLGAGPSLVFSEVFGTAYRIVRVGADGGA